jgi:xylulose-5-phosphate/fructose-6-phosphate phosphoketolase
VHCHLVINLDHLSREVQELGARMVNVDDLFNLQSQRDHPHGLDDKSFTALFADEAPVVFGFHGYTDVIHELIYQRSNPSPFHIRSYIEEGATTTPFDMVVVNHLSRYDLAIKALRRVARIRNKAMAIIQKFEQKLGTHRAFIENHDADMPEVLNSH